MGGDKWNKCCFTIFLENWDPKEIVKNNNITFLTCQKEKCPTTNRIHWQGYYECKTRVGIKGHQVNLDAPKQHVSRAMGSAEDNIAYCNKSDTRIDEPFTYGSISKQGKRNDLIELKKSIDEGKTLKEIADEHFTEFIKFHRGIKEYMNLNRIRRNWKTKVIIIVGPPGCGKSRYAWETYPDAYDLRNSDTGLWWDGYDNHKTVIIDDFYGWIKYDTLLRLCDRYPMMVDTKGGACNFVAENIIITSNSQPEEWYPNISCNINRWGAFLRRIDEKRNLYLLGGKAAEVEGNTDLD